jgi:hypothetical protein
MPQITTTLILSNAGKLLLNGEELQASESGTHDYRIKQVYTGVPLKREWNHFLIKVASDKYWWPQAGSLFVKM